MLSRASCVIMALAVLLLTALTTTLRRPLPLSILLVFSGSVAALMLLGCLW